MPFPSAETTPPVTKTYFGARALTGFQGSNRSGRRLVLRKVVKGYLTRRDLVAVVAILLATGAAAGISMALLGTPSAFGPGDRAKRVEMSVTGTATNGISARYLDDNVGDAVLALHAKLPFRTSSRVDGADFYEIYVRLVDGGNITCTVRLGTVVATGRASGAHGTCTAVVSHNFRALGYHGG
jgi:hypothetical protein